MNLQETSAIRRWRWLAALVRVSSQAESVMGMHLFIQLLGSGGRIQTVGRIFIRLVVKVIERSEKF
jgi:EAL domain-containing protein (putative c-di-GMP-specific phosphodiesterase class I)